MKVVLCHGCFDIFHFGHLVYLTEAKKHATGRGNADKAAVIAAMRGHGHAVTDDNEADALAVWYCARERMLNV